MQFRNIKKCLCIFILISKELTVVYVTDQPPVWETALVLSTFTTGVSPFRAHAPLRFMFIWKPGSLINTQFFKKTHV